VTPADQVLTLAYDYNQLYIYDAGREFSEDANEYLDALDAMKRAGLAVGEASGVVDVLMPRQDNFAVTLALKVVESAPSVIEGADHIVEFDVIAAGRIALEGSGGSGLTEVEVPAGHYRARLTGFDFDAASAWSYDDPGDPADHYRLELWREDDPSPVAELRRWPGMASRM
jgi:hypothetical protein